MDARGDRETTPLNNIGPVTITTPGDRRIVITRLFDAPRALVFEAWTKAEHVAHWWDPSGVPLAVCEIDLRQGGTFRWVNRAPDGGEGHSFRWHLSRNRSARKARLYRSRQSRAGWDADLP